jgi:cell division protein FtsL
MKMTNQQPEKNPWKSDFKFWSGLPFIIVRRIIVVLLTGIFIFLFVQIEVDNYSLRQEINKLKTIPPSDLTL